MSSFFDGLAFCHCLARPQAHAEIVAHLKDVADKGLFRVPKDLGVSLNDKFNGACDVRTRSIVFPHSLGESNLDIATAGSVGAGRGLTLTYLHLCLRGDALVNVSDGNLVPISQLRCGDSVRTHEGHLSIVKSISSRPVELGEKILQIRSWLNMERVCLTSEHKVFTSQGWVIAGDLKPGDEIGTHIRRIRGGLYGSNTKPYRDRIGRKKRGNDEYYIDFTSEFGFFCGYYLAEGHVHGSTWHGEKFVSNIGLAHNKNEQRFADRAIRAVSRYISSHRTDLLEGQRASTVVYGAALARFIKDNFGMKDEKKIPEWVFDCPGGFIEGIIEGYIAGDGSKTIASKQNYNCPTIYVTSVRARLLYQLRHLLASVGWGWGGVTWKKGFTDGRGWKNREAWTLSISGLTALKLRERLSLFSLSKEDASRSKRTSACKYRLDSHYVWTKIREITEDHADTVWDIEVDHPDHSFETVIGAVANSEAAQYPGQESFLSILPAVSKAPDTVIVLESTAQGKTGIGETFYEYWNSANRTGAKWNGFVPIFLSWLDDPACFRPAHEAEDAPANDFEKDLMGKPFNATLGQIAWMRMVMEGECRGSELMFSQEYPWTPEVAFVASGDPAFTTSELKYSFGTKTPAIARGSFTQSGDKPVFLKNPRGKLFIWEMPQRNCHYYIGVDCARGIEAETGRASGDFAAYVVLNGTTGDVAARFSDWVNPIEMANDVDKAGRFYNNAMMNIELTGNLGLWCQQVLRDQYRYPNWYIWKGKDDKMPGKSKSHAMGFETQGRSRDLLLATFRGKLHDGMDNRPGGLALKDEELISQMDKMTMATGMRWEIEHGHDDVFMACCFAVIACAQYPPPNIISWKANYLDKDKSAISKMAGLKPQENLQLALRQDLAMILRPAPKRCRSILGEI